jgi:hypothetical protein
MADLANQLQDAPGGLQRVLHVFEEALNTLSFQFEKLRMYLPDLQII